MFGTLLAGPGTVLTLDPANPVLHEASVYVEDGLVRELGPARELEARYGGVPRLDAAGGVILPGFVLAHTHFYGAYARGIDVGQPGPTNFPEILQRLWWRLDAALTPQDVENCALLGLAACARAGTTAVVDHHASPHAIEGSLTRIRRAADLLGLRTCLCYEVTDRHGVDGAERGLAENLRYARECRPGGGEGASAGWADPRHCAALGLHASMTLNPDTLERSAAAALRAGLAVHVHVAEDRSDQQDAQRRYGMRVVERLAESGALDGPALLAHCLHLEDRELDLMAEHGATVIHNPESNMNNAVGWADLPRLRSKGLEPALGTDGMSADLPRAVRAAALLERHQTGDPRTGWDAPGRLLAANTRLAETLWGLPLGVLKPGAGGDLCVRAYDPPTPLTTANWQGHLVFGLVDAPTVHTVVAGRPVLRDGALQANLDEPALNARCREAAAALAGRW